MALTKRGIDSYQWNGKSKDIRWDTGPGSVRGFGVRINQGGSKTFLVEYRLIGERNHSLHSLGKYGVLTLTQARERARKTLVDVMDGLDPNVPPPSEITLKEYSVLYLANAEVRGVKSVERMKSRLNERILPALGNWKMERIKRADCQSLHDDISAEEDQPLVEANRCLQLLRAMFTRAELSGKITEGHYNPVKGIEFHPETPGTRYLDELEIKRLDNALKAEPVHIRCMVRLFLLLGMRRGELLSMPWSAVKIGHPEGDHIDISMTKNGRDLKLALSPEVVVIFNTLKEIQDLYEKTRNNDWVFPSRWYNYTQPVQDFDRHWKRVREVANIMDCTVHDLRRTCGSIMIQNSVPLEYVQRVLNHTDPEITRVYARMSSDNQREALSTASEVLNNIFGKLVA